MACREGAHAREVRSVHKAAKSVVAKDWVGLSGKGSHKENRTAVVIVILELHAHARDCLAMVAERYAAQQRHFLKGAVSFVVEQEIGHVVVRYEHVRISVLIIVRETYAHSPPWMRGDAGLFAHVFERSVAA